METVKTLKDLEFWCLEKNIPLEKARFALGEDKTEKRWFGIYQKDNGEWVVYKNKDDGTRFIRYQGDSEEEAVKILHDKIKSEIRLRKTGAASPTAKKKRKRKKITDIIGFIAFVIVVFNLLVTLVTCTYNHRHNGYYEYNNKHFYRKNSKWYYYDPYVEMWYPDYYSYADDIFYETYKDYYIGDDYNYGSDYSDFKDSEYYHDSSNDSYDDDYDYDWDSGSSWDSYDTDWGSDW